MNKLNLKVLSFLKEIRFSLDIRKTFFYHEGDETLGGVAQRGCGCSIIGSVQIRRGALIL